MLAYPVSTLVNKPQNDVPKCIGLATAPLHKNLAGFVTEFRIVL
jgi:hypothetical protein